MKDTELVQLKQNIRVLLGQRTLLDAKIEALTERVLRLSCANSPESRLEFDSVTGDLVVIDPGKK